MSGLGQDLIAGLDSGTDSWITPNISYFYNNKAPEKQKRIYGIPCQDTCQYTHTQKS